MSEEAQQQTETNPQSVSETPRVESNLEETVMPDTESQPEQAEEVVAQDSLFAETEAAMEAENRPEWLPEKFKTGEDLSKSYKELEKKLGAHVGAPENYEMAIEEGLEDYSITSDDPFATDFAKVLKEGGINQDTYNKIANLYFAKVKADDESISDAHEHQFREDCKEIGEDRVKEIKESINWAKGILPDKSFGILKQIGEKDITIGLMIQEFHQAYESKSYIKLPENDTEIVDKSELREKAIKMMDDPRYSSDAKWRKDTDELYQRVLI